MSKLTLEVIGRCGFGRSFGSFSRDAVDPFVTAMLRALDYSQRSSIPIPILGALLGRAEAKQNAADIAYLHSVVDEVIAARTGNPGAHADLLDLMLTNPDPETGQQLDLENVRDQVITFLIAGHETSSNALSFALHLLATHPDIAARARAEIDAMWPDASAPSLSFDQVPKLRYIRRVIDETLRLWPSAPGYFREAIADTTVAGGYGFKAGDWAFVLLLRLHRDPVWGPIPSVSIRIDSCRRTSRPGPATSTGRSGRGFARASDANSRCTRWCSLSPRSCTSTTWWPTLTTPSRSMSC